MGVPSVAHLQDIQTDATIVASRAAPGENMPVRVRLSNFGDASRADGTITYAIVDSDGREVQSESETVAIETTATFIHSLLLPNSIQPGQYTVRVFVSYRGQQAPAVSSYPFTVERKIAGIFESDLLRYGIIALVSVLFVLGLVWIFEKYHHRAVARHDYSEIESKDRIYYEMVSDIIQQMRLHEGDKALLMAAKIPGLSIDTASGRVSHVEKDPATVVASLVSEYESVFGKHINLSLKGMNGRAIVKSGSR